MSLLGAIDISSSGLAAQRRRVEVTSANLANSQTTRTEEGGPYRRKDVVFRTAPFGDELGNALSNALSGVEVDGVVDDPTPFEKRHEPGHPDADAEGYVLYPNVRPMEEMANLVNAARSYEANLASINIVKSMIAKTLELGR